MAPFSLCSGGAIHLAGDASSYCRIHSAAVHFSRLKESDGGCCARLLGNGCKVKLMNVWNGPLFSLFFLSTPLYISPFTIFSSLLFYSLVLFSSPSSSPPPPPLSVVCIINRLLLISPRLPPSFCSLLSCHFSPLSAPPQAGARCGQFVDLHHCPLCVFTLLHSLRL